MGMGNDWLEEEMMRQVGYEIAGEARIVGNASAHKLVKRLQHELDMAGRRPGITVDVEHHEDGTFTLIMDGSMVCHYTLPDSIEGILRALGPHVVGGAACFTTKYDEDPDEYEIWAGSPEAVEKAIAEMDMEGAREVLRQLTKEQIVQLIEEMQDPQFFAPGPKPQR